MLPIKLRNRLTDEHIRATMQDKTLFPCLRVCKIITRCDGFRSCADYQAYERAHKPTVLLPPRPDRRRIENGAGISTWNEYLRDLEKWADAVEPLLERWQRFVETLKGQQG